MIAVEVTEQGDVNSRVKPRIQRVHDPSQQPDAVEQDRVGQDAQPAQLDEHGRMTQERQARERLHRRHSPSWPLAGPSSRIPQPAAGEEHNGSIQAS